MEQLGLGEVESSSVTSTMRVGGWVAPWPALRWKPGWKTEHEWNEQIVSVFFAVHSRKLLLSSLDCLLKDSDPKSFKIIVRGIKREKKWSCVSRKELSYINTWIILKGSVRQTCLQKIEVFWLFWSKPRVIWSTLVLPLFPSCAEALERLEHPLLSFLSLSARVVERQHIRNLFY